jgi:hypothetical protein
VHQNKPRQRAPSLFWHPRHRRAKYDFGCRYYLGGAADRVLTRPGQARQEQIAEPASRPSGINQMRQRYSQPRSDPQGRTEPGRPRPGRRAGPSWLQSRWPGSAVCSGRCGPAQPCRRPVFDRPGRPSRRSSPRSIQPARSPVQPDRPGRPSRRSSPHQPSQPSPRSSPTGPAGRAGGLARAGRVVQCLVRRPGRRGSLPLPRGPGRGRRACGTVAARGS